MIGEIIKSTNKQRSIILAKFELPPHRMPQGPLDSFIVIPDIIVVEDDDVTRMLVKYCAEDSGLVCLDFSSGSQVLQYLKTIQAEGLEFPFAFLCDMKTTRTMTDIEELNSPEEIFMFLNKLGKAENFCFYTGNLSKHDEEVIARTQARYFIKSAAIKSDSGESLFIEEIKRKIDLLNNN